MIPSLLLIKSNNKNHVALTQKRNIQIGIQKDSDIIINHPHFVNHTQALGLNSTRSERQKNVKTKIHFVFPTHTFNIDGLSLRLVNLKMFFCILFFLCIGIVPIIILFPGHSNRSTVQDWTPLMLPANGIYGFCRQDRTHKEGVSFKFEANASQAYKMVFYAGGKGDGTIIRLSLNGSVINRSLSLPTGWGDETSITLPSSVIRDGENSIKIKPLSLKANPTSWGISQVRVVPISRSHSNIQDITSHAFKEIISALGNQELDGAELSHYYKIVGSLETSDLSGSSSFDIDSVMKKIEQRMKDKVLQVAFEVRSNQILGDQSTVRQLLDETRDWIPEGWVEGWEIYNELSQ